MNPVVETALASWPSEPGLAAGLLAGAIVYLRGWRAYHRKDPVRWHAGRLAAFFGGLAVIYLALASPLDLFATFLLSVHMTQHLLLMMVAPPLIWLGAPLLPLVRGLPEQVRTYWVIPLFQCAWLRRFTAWLTHPVPALVLFVAVMWGWHIPALYELALREPFWHFVQHTCFVGAGLVFWYPVVRPYPARPAWPVWLLFPFLLIADLANTLLSALLTFSDRVLYRHYESFSRIGAGTALDDQSAAGALMWVPGSIAFLLPLFVIGVRWLLAEEAIASAPFPRRVGEEARPQTRFALPLLSASSPDPQFDLLRVPVLGQFLRWRYARPVLQLPLLVLAIAVIVDGLLGPDIAPLNLAGVLPWIHWRGLIIIGLFVAGNVFCTACPFTLPRTLARRWLPAGMVWPRRLRGKWLAIVLIVAFFTSYEAFALWNSPRLTALIILGYFAAAFVIDGLFRGAAFCKYVCPIGQFNFVQSLASPLEVAVRDPAICSACKTKDCVRGRDGIPGCELDLAQPHKHGNMNCTFCLDCVHACPHGNIGVLGGVPGRGLDDDRFRSGIGRFSRRPDLAALVVVLVFAAFVNAAGMVGPVLEWESHLKQCLGIEAALITIVLDMLALIVVPVLAVGLAARASRYLGKLEKSALEVATRFAFALVPLGFAMWVAHYGYHLAVSYDAAWPVAHRAAADVGIANLGEPNWTGACCRGAGEWVTKAQIVILDLGLLGTLYIALRIARDVARSGCVAGAVVPWAVLAGLLFAIGIWILLQPMEMRGMLGGASPAPL